MCLFKIIRSGYELNVVHQESIDNVIKIASHNDHIFMLTKSKQLFFGTFNANGPQTQIQFEVIREDVIDVACSIDSIYVITTSYTLQHCPLMAFDFDKRWNDIPILNYGAIYEGVASNSSNSSIVRVVEVSCNNDGALFITADRELYAMGNFNEVCKSDQPMKVAQFINYEILQVAMGKHFAVILTRKRSTHGTYATASHTSHIDSSSCDDSIHSWSPAATSITECDNISLQSTATLDHLDSNSLNSSNLSVRTVTYNNNNNYNNNDNTDTDSSTTEHSFPSDIEHTIGRLLKMNDQIQTQVWCFGSINQSGQLGVGDHIKRAQAVEVTSLRDQGVVYICSGDDHTAALTLDARLYLWGDNTNEQISHWLDKQDCSSPKRFYKTEQNIFAVQCGQQSTFIITNSGERHELSRNKYFPTVNIQQITMQNDQFLFLASKQYLVVGDTWTKLRFEEYLKFEQQFLQDILQNTRPHMEKFLRHMNRDINIKHSQLYRQFGEQYKSISELCAKNVSTLLNYACYKVDFMSIAFIRYHMKYVYAFRQYAKLYCETLCADDLSRVSQSIIPNADFVSKFSTPIHHTLNYKNLINELLEANDKNDLLQAAQENWTRFSRDVNDMLRLAHSTIDFWTTNQKNIPPTLQLPERRYILDSKSEFTLKLLPSSRFKSNWFILFNDIFCHSTGSSSSLKQYPLKTVWLSNVIDKEVSPSSSSSSTSSSATSTLNARKHAFKIITPEEQFLISAVTEDVKMHWLKSFDQQIRYALGKSNSKSSLLRRTTSYTFSDKHRIYPTCKYLGQWYGGKIDGIGCIEYPDGRIYTGQLKANSIVGYGRLVMTNGSYEGHFVDGHFDGFGTLETHQSTENYEGYFKNGLKHGFGIQQEFDTMRTYMGEFMNGSPCGYGVDDSESGKYMGNFVDGHRNGHGICITADGTYFEGNFIENELLNGSSVAYFANGSYYVGDLSIRGPNGRGTLYVPIDSVQNEVNLDMDMDSLTTAVRGNILSGSLGGNWETVKINSGTMQTNQLFDKYPSQFSHQKIDKWTSLFSDWEHDVFGGPINDINDPFRVWTKITEFIDSVKHTEVLKSTISTSAIVYKSGSQANKTQQQSSQTSHFLHELHLSNSHEYHVSKSLSLSRITGKNYKRNLLAVERTKSISNEFLNSAVNFTADAKNVTVNAETRDTKTDLNADERLALSTALSSSVPCFGVTKLDANDLRLVRDYLTKAFKNQYHPLGILNAKISYCFYTSYGCWKVKPVSILSTHAMQEWESISRRIFDILRKMFPTLPQEYGTIDDEFISHRSLLYPILLSEGIYSTLFVLYANKCSKRDEIYRQRIQLSEKFSDAELASFLKLSSKYLELINNTEFGLAKITLKQVTEKYCPREMLNLIEQTFKHVENAAEMVSKSNQPNINHEMDTECNKDSKVSNAALEVIQLNADKLMPLTIFLLLRAAIPHLGTEILLLEDLMGPDFEFVMTGNAGYLFTTLKAAYSHIINDSFLQ